jgi:hypothetical protein
MDFQKLMYLLENQSLWFSRADQFEDPLEGTFTDAELEYWRSPDAAKASQGSPGPNGYFNTEQQMRATAYVSCWRGGAKESMAMWDLYGKGRGMVAIKTTVSNLKQAISEFPLRIFLGQVEDVDWSLSTWSNNALVLCFRKDSSYQHEAEVRAVIWDQGIISKTISDVLEAKRARGDFSVSPNNQFLLGKAEGQPKIEVAIDIARFVTEIVVGPREDRTFAALIDTMLKRYGLEIPMMISSRLKPRQYLGAGDPSNNQT